MKNNEEDKKLRDIIAQLETKVDLLEAEIVNLNELLIQFGFSKGIASLKKSIEEIMSFDNRKEDIENL